MILLFIRHLHLLLMTYLQNIAFLMSYFFLKFSIFTKNLLFLYNNLYKFQQNDKTTVKSAINSAIDIEGMLYEKRDELFNWSNL
jgi:hypothetical protein